MEKINERMCSYFLRTPGTKRPICVCRINSINKDDVRYKFSCKGCKAYSAIDSRLRRKAVEEEEILLGLRKDPYDDKSEKGGVEDEGE